MERLIELGFKQDENMSEFHRVFDGGLFSEIYVDAYSNQPYMLFSRVHEVGVHSSVDEDRIKINDKDGKTILNVLVKHIKDCCYKGDQYMHTFSFKVYDICYRILAIVD